MDQSAGKVVTQLTLIVVSVGVALDCRWLIEDEMVEASGKIDSPRYNSFWERLLVVEQVFPGSRSWKGHTTGWKSKRSSGWQGGRWWYHSQIDLRCTSAFQTVLLLMGPRQWIVHHIHIKLS